MRIFSKRISMVDLPISRNISILRLLRSRRTGRMNWKKGSTRSRRKSGSGRRHGRRFGVNSAIRTPASEAIYPHRGIHPVESVGDRTHFASLKFPGILPHIGFRYHTDLPDTVSLTVNDFMNHHWSGRKLTQEEFLTEATEAIEKIYSGIKRRLEQKPSQKLLKTESRKSLSRRSSGSSAELGRV
jgi:hypothetical protein